MDISWGKREDPKLLPKKASEKFHALPLQSPHRLGGASFTITPLTTTGCYLYDTRLTRPKRVLNAIMTVRLQ